MSGRLDRRGSGNDSQTVQADVADSGSTGGGLQDPLDAGSLRDPLGASMMRDTLTATAPAVQMGGEGDGGGEANPDGPPPERTNVRMAWHERFGSFGVDSILPILTAEPFSLATADALHLTTEETTAHRLHGDLLGYQLEEGAPIQVNMRLERSASGSWLNIWLATEPEVQLYTFDYGGQTLTMRPIAYRAFCNDLIGVLLPRVRGILRGVESADSVFDSMRALNRDQVVIAFLCESLGGLELPDHAVLDDAMGAAQSAVAVCVPGGDLTRVVERSNTAEELGNTAITAVNNYRSRLIGTAEAIVATLEFTRDVCFAIAGAAGGAALGGGVLAGASASAAATAVNRLTQEAAEYAMLDDADTVGDRLSEVGRDTALSFLTNVSGNAAGDALARPLARWIFPRVGLHRGLEVFQRFNSEAALADYISGHLGNQLGGAASDLISDGVPDTMDEMWDFLTSRLIDAIGAEGPTRAS